MQSPEKYGSTYSGFTVQTDSPTETEIRPGGFGANPEILPLGPDCLDVLVLPPCSCRCQIAISAYRHNTYFEARIVFYDQNVPLSTRAGGTSSLPDVLLYLELERRLMRRAARPGEAPG